MTKEQVLKHKEAIEFFINNPDRGVWTKHQSGSGWKLDTAPNFLPLQIYVPNDDFAEFRKALINGKSIQSKIDYICPSSASANLNNDWNENWDPAIYGFHFTPEFYRIKPDEPKFRVGDWVYDYEDTLVQIKHPDDTNAKWIKNIMAS